MPNLSLSLYLLQGLDSLPCCSETYKWAWFRRYCMAARVARALVERTELPQPFCLEVRQGAKCDLSNHEFIQLLIH